MGNRGKYDLKLAELSAISVGDVKTPHHIPVPSYIQEADILCHWAEKDKEALTAAGLSWELVEDIPLRNGALIHAEAVWSKQRTGGKEANREWAEESPVAYRLRDRLFKDFRYAFRKHPNLLKIVKATAAGQGHADMIQDLNDLAVMGKNYASLLEPIGFDLSLLDTAAQTAVQMAKLLARATTARREYSELKLMRDRAYTYLKAAVDEVRQCGKYVFDKTSPRFRGYASQHLRKRRQQARARNKKIQKVEPGKK
ncbi:MAG: hypothetical protein GY940_07440 [bacterium]|nr:hypothetical protein [bacterium]